VPLINGFHLKNLRGDVYGGLTAAVVALPLALAFGVASGVGPIAGLYGAAIVGFFAALLGGTPSQISGPTGPMTVVMAIVVLKFMDQPVIAFTVIMMAGVFQVGFGLLRLGNLITLVPYTVVSGFMSGIGVIIIIFQLGPLFGHAVPVGGVLATLSALPKMLISFKWDALAVGLGALAIVWITPHKFNRILPSPLLALIFGTIVVMNYLPGVATLGNIPTGLPELHAPIISWARLPEMIGWALILALLGSIDSLLTSLIADSVTQTQHLSDRELVGQGVGNFFAGVFGGIPGAGATMRTLVNIRAGGATPISGMLHAIIILVIVLGAAPLVGFIPNAVLAGILIKVGIDIVDWEYLKRVRYAPKAGVFIMFLVLVLTVLVDLIIAFGVGMVAASLLLVKRMANHQLATISVVTGIENDLFLSEIEKKIFSKYYERFVFYYFNGPISFGAARGLTKRLLLEGDQKVLVLNLEDVPSVDTTVAIILIEIITNTRKNGGEVVLICSNLCVLDVLGHLGVHDSLPKTQIVDNREIGLEMVERLLG
jgi:SulP family sulfate permease